MNKQPPKRSLQFLRWFCREDYLEEIEGNLIELFEQQHEASPRKAEWAFFWQVLLHFRPDFIKSVNLSKLLIQPDMFKHYFKVTWRNLMKQKLYSFINIGGLAIGLTCFLLIFLFVRHEYGYDQFYANSDRIHRVVQRMEGNESFGSDLYGYTTVGLAPALVADYPEVEAATTLMDQTALLSFEENHFYENGIRADAHFFEVFHQPLIRGKVQTVLSKADGLVLSESLAHKIFGKKDPMGQTVMYQDRTPLTVTGIMQDLPNQSSLQFSFLTSMLSSRQYVREMKEDQWDNNDYYTFFSLSEETDPAILQEKMPAFLNKHKKLPEDFPFKLSYLIRPLSELHFENEVNFDIGLKGNAKYVTLLFWVAMLVLLLACVNYTNLAIARSIRRAREVGMRKVVGAVRRQLMVQFLGESVFITFLGFLLALGLSQVLMPYFGALLDRPLELNLSDVTYLLPSMISLILVVGLFAGSYPALLMSSLRPIHILGGKGFGRLSNLKLQRGLLIGQYAISIVLIISSLVIYLQFRYIQNKELGYDKDHIVMLPVLDTKIRDQFPNLKNEWERNPNILSVSSTTQLPTNLKHNTIIRHEKQTYEEGIFTYRAWVDHDFLKTFGMELIAGRNFSTDITTDSTSARIINETAARALGWTAEEAIGKTFKEATPKTIIGVVKDFHLHSMHSEIAPMMFQIRNRYISHIAVKVSPDHLSETVAQLESSIKAYSPYPFEYAFLDEEFDRLYQADRRVGELFGFFTILSILIASLGLFGLAAFVARQRTKEIGIRKVLGASVNSIVGMLSKDFLKMVLWGFILAIPIAWYGMTRWLEDFAYRISLEWWIFLAAGIFVLVLAFLTVSAQSWKAASTNPVSSLKSE